MRGRAIVLLAVLGLALPAGAAPATQDAALEKALAALRGKGFGAAARVIAARTAQRQAKMRLTVVDARGAAAALLLFLPRMPSARRLHDVMPQSTVELVRAVAERGVPEAEAEALAAYLTRAVQVLRCANLPQLDRNHSHVVGRHWHEIDYTGEGTTWQARRDHWARLGVADFRTARHVHRYFVAESKLAYFRRIYKPRGRMADVPAP